MYWLYKSDFGWKANWAIQGEALRTHGNSQQWDSASRELPFICEPRFQWLFSEPKIRSHSLCQKIFLLFLGGSGDPRDVCIFSAQQSVTFKILMAYAEMAELLKSASPPKSNMVTSHSSAAARSARLEEAATVVFLLFSVSFRSEWGRSSWPKSMQRLPLLPASSQGAEDRGGRGPLQQFRDPLNGREIPDHRSEGSCRSGVEK